MMPKIHKTALETFEEHMSQAQDLLADVEQLLGELDAWDDHQIDWNVVGSIDTVRTKLKQAQLVLAAVVYDPARAIAHPEGDLSQVEEDAR